jgi:hypothetical protein
LFQWAHERGVPVPADGVAKFPLLQGLWKEGIVEFDVKEEIRRIFLNPIESPVGQLPAVAFYDDFPGDAHEVGIAVRQHSYRRQG